MTVLDYPKIKEPKEAIENRGGLASIVSDIEGSWAAIAPFWPLKNLIATNPLAGFEDLPFELALKEGNAFFQQKEVPAQMEEVNRESIKWFQPFFDEGQSTIAMPLRHQGLFTSVRQLLRFDSRIKGKRGWIDSLPQDPLGAIEKCLLFLGIPSEEIGRFLTLMLTTLPGWASYVKYLTEWRQEKISAPNVTKQEYLALRLILTSLFWPSAGDLLAWHDQARTRADVAKKIKEVERAEKSYRSALVNKIKNTKNKIEKRGCAAQLVFCIDVRSEPFRRAIEEQGEYETYGFAGFFGVPVSIRSPASSGSYASCPVLVKPTHEVAEVPVAPHRLTVSRVKTVTKIVGLYQSVKNSFSTPFSLVETVGSAFGVWMTIRNFTPRLAAQLHLLISPSFTTEPVLDSVPYEQLFAWGIGALETMGLTQNFSRLVILCGHASKTQNNAYATSLNCGACGGHSGAPNARILAAILNDPRVRQHLSSARGIEIPKDTVFVAALHNTTTDDVELFDTPACQNVKEQTKALLIDLKRAQSLNAYRRSLKMGIKTRPSAAIREMTVRSHDWAQVRPEWGLAQNGSFIVAPRWKTKGQDLEGRAFLHSYEWGEDEKGTILSSILTGPMVVAQWINAQYFFSTFDNIAYGSGSKVTKNITGKIGVIQGNASDLMHGLPLQSVFKTDEDPYHDAVRLTTVVYAPRSLLDTTIGKQALLQKLFGNGWVYLICLDPETESCYLLERDFTWCLV